MHDLSLELVRVETLIHECGICTPSGRLVPILGIFRLEIKRRETGC
jgi:uncharacterized membrane protein YecN with MAPEG domain